MKRLTGMVLLGSFAIWGCRKHYAPPAIAANNHYLVVEGVVNAGADSTVINLSRTVSISGNVNKTPETGATVTIQGDQNLSYALSETDSGRYVSSPLNLDIAHKYKLTIKTADGRTYASNYEAVKVTPAIDSVGYQVNATGLNFYVNTHDPSNSSRYYRWDYAETYVYNSALNSYFKYTSKPVYYTQQSVPRTPSEYIHTCYVTLNSSTVILNSSARLTKDVIDQTPITRVASTSEKISYRYSILVRQYALTREAYEFWSLLKKNTEELGTIFDAQPSAAKTNLYCMSNPAEPVIGYFSVCTIAQKRIFVDKSDLPPWFIYPPQCDTGSVSWYKKSAVAPADLLDTVEIPLGIVMSGYDSKVKDSVYNLKTGYYSCVDCRYHLNGRTQKPAFWK